MAEIAVCEDGTVGGKLVGLINVEDVLTAPESAAASALMDASPPSVRHGTDQEAAAWLAVLAGLILAAVFFPTVALIWRKPDVALAVALALMAACSIASVVAMALPWIFHRLGADPAFGSGPLATVIQDLLTILIYFVIGVALVQPTLPG